jgi:ribosomal protein L32
MTPHPPKPSAETQKEPLKHQFVKCPGCRYEHLCLVHRICFHCGHEIKDKERR